MTCEECRELLPLYVTGALEEAEAAAVRQHLLAGCPDCQGELAATEAAFQQVPLGLKPREVPAGAWEKIAQRVALQERMEGAAAPARGAAVSRRSPWTQWAAAAAVIVLALLLWKAQSDLTTQEQRAHDMEHRMAAMEDQLKYLGYLNNKMLARLKTEREQTLAQMSNLLTATSYEMTAAAQAPQAKLFWNKTEGTWTLIATGVKPCAAGKTYELWIINKAGEKIPAGTFVPDSQGRAVHEVKLPANAGSIVMAAVTDEPIGGVSAPTGAIQFAGNL